MTKKIFLATTALQDFWNKERGLCFLGEWCKLYENRDELTKINSITFKYIWDSVKKKEEAFNYCFDVYEKVIVDLKNELNTIHGIDKDELYYKTILGAWLLRYLFQLYDKYMTLKEFIVEYKDFDTFLLDKSCYVIPLDYNDSMSFVDDDLFHLQQYSNILLSLGYSFPSKKSKKKISQKRVYKRNANKGSFVKRIFFKFQNQLNRLLHKKVILLVNPYFDKTFSKVTQLFFKSHFSILFNDFAYKVDFNFDINHSYRRKKLASSEVEFEQIVYENILKDIPIIFLEGYKEFKNQVLNSTREIKNIDLIYTTNSLYGNEVFKFYLAEYKLHNKLLVHQHGNSYGVDRFVMGERYESSLSKIFYTWGWGDGLKFRYLSSSKIKHKSISKIEKYDIDILYIMTALPRYLYVFKPYIISSDFLYSYMKNSISLLELITKNKDSHITIREYFSDYKWNIQQRIYDSDAIHGKLIFDNQSNIYEQIKSSQICVFDHFQTTALETLAMNKPTIILIDKNVYGYRDEAQPYFQKLLDAKILHFTPQNVISHIQNFKNIEEWWKTAEVQEAREEFCYRYARTSENWADEWTKEFNRVLEEYARA